MMRIGAPLPNVPIAADTPAGDRNIDAAGDHRLDRFRACRRIEDIEIEAVLLENAAALAEFGNAGIPGAFLRDGHLERVVGGRGADAPTSAMAETTAMASLRMISSGTMTGPILPIILLP